MYFGLRETITRKMTLSQLTLSQLRRNAESAT